MEKAMKLSITAAIGFSVFGLVCAGLAPAASGQSDRHFQAGAGDFVGTILDPNLAEARGSGALKAFPRQPRPQKLQQQHSGQQIQEFEDNLEFGLDMTESAHDPMH
jgi:hypothetical protein